MGLGELSRGVKIIEETDPLVDAQKKVGMRNCPRMMEKRPWGHGDEPSIA